MINKLEGLCEERGIKVEFISNKFIDGDSGTKHNQPIIKVHKIFKECPMKVATAVVEIFTGEGYTSECIEIIERYLKEKFGPIGIRIQPPKVVTTKPVYKAENKTYKDKEAKYCNKEEQYIEADISSIDAISMKGMQKKLVDNETLMAKEQDILELNIVVTPPIT